MDYKLTMRSEMDTIEFAQNLESEKFPNMVICLNGELGSGKTLFTKAFANVMGVKENVTSPTFNIIKEYDGELPLYHMDVYRLDGDTSSVDIEDYYILPTNRLDIKFKIVGENSRILIVTPHGKEYEELCETVL